MSSGEPSLFDDDATGPSGPVVRVRLEIAYDGGGFRGLAPNPGVRTVVGELRELYAPMLGYVPDITMSGRTDAGVHARRQTLTLDVPAAFEIDRLATVVNRRRVDDVAVLSVEAAPDDFDARHSATGRRYRYRVLSGSVPDPLLAGRVWWVRNELSVPAMQSAADAFIGEHDFSSFCRRPKGTETPVSLVRRVREANWRVVDHPLDIPEARLLEFEIEGPAFCHQMVRSIVAFCVAVGRGQRSAADVLPTLAARDRNASVSPAPPDGLTLWDVTYGEPVGRSTPRIRVG